MFFLASRFWPILPEPGLLFWTIVIFGIFWTIMYKYAFGAIGDALERRNGEIDDALQSAKKAREEMANLKAENEKLLAQAREERAQILKDAKEVSAKTIEEAKEKAKEEAKKILDNANRDIANQKAQAMGEVKTQAGSMALEIAEKVIRKELKSNAEHVSLVNSLVNEIKLN